MLRRIALKNFKSFVDESAEIAPFTLLVGANASGKSNFLDALRFLHGIAQGWTVEEVASGRFAGSTKVWPGIRGGGAEMIRVGEPTAALSTYWEPIPGVSVDHAIAFDRWSVLRESLNDAFTATKSTRIADGQEVLSGRWLAHDAVDTDPARSALFQSAAPTGNGTPARSVFQTISFLDFRVEAMRDYVEKPQAAAPAVQVENGRNLSAVMWSFCRDVETRQQFVDWLAEFCASEIRDLEFEETESGYVMLRIVEHDGTRISARSMSDGTLRFLALLTALRSPQRLSVIEDLEHALHPSRLRLLVDVIASRTGDTRSFPRTQVIATTHSPELLEAALEVPHCNVILCARIPGQAGTVLRDVRSLPDFEAVHKRRDFAYLLNTGWLERAV